MATATKAFPWDHFLAEGSRQAVEGFRRVQWPNIRRELGKAPYNCPLPQGLEPCWVDPGKAIYWQEQILRTAVVKTDDSGREYRVLEDSSQGFQPTGPLPANNPSQIAGYLKKGFLLRPPGQVVVEVEDPAPDGVPAQAPRIFTCFRHGTDRKAFPVWKSYVRHCAHYGEALEEPIPEEVLDRAARFAFYCFVHDKGFTHATSAGRHRASELKRPGRSFHPSLNDMRMEKEEN